jgi:hypothetical protein
MAGWPKQVERELEHPLNPVVRGIALERIGQYNASRDYYKSLANEEGETSLGQFARKRLLAVLDKWADYEYEQENRPAGQEHQKERDRHRKEWGIDENEHEQIPSNLRLEDVISAIRPERLNDDKEQTDTTGRSENPPPSSAQIEETSSEESTASSDSISTETGSSRPSHKNKLDMNFDINVRRDAQHRRVTVSFGNSSSEQQGLIIDFERGDLASNGFVDLEKDYSQEDQERIDFKLNREDREYEMSGSFYLEEPRQLKLQLRGLPDMLTLQV